MSVLVTGGAGYIGSVTVELLRAQGEQVVVLDNLSRGHRKAVDPSIPFYHGDVGDEQVLKRILSERALDACIHFAAFAYVGESVSEPEKYYRNNVEQGIRLLDALRTAGVRRFIFSSTCATYGEPTQVPIPETHPQWPANPYGWSKFMLERVLEAYSAAHDFRFVALRYFNAAGATSSRGEDHSPESHLIPLVLRVAQGHLPLVKIFGTDYPTPDGTAVRDYIHVHDLGTAHVQALKYLRDGGSSQFVNLGNGTGYSVKEVIDTAQAVSGCPIRTELAPRRAGDPSRLIAVADKAKNLLGWKPQYPDLKAIVQTAWDWHQKHPNGYDDK